MNRPIRTLMLGWEFPPLISGGLGTACYGLTRAMDQLGMQIIFMLPNSQPLRFGHTEPAYTAEGWESSTADFEHIRFLPVTSGLTPYLSAASRTSLQHVSEDLAGPENFWSESALAGPGGTRPAVYASDLFEMVSDYTRKTVNAARKETFDLVHAHDWMTFPAAIAAAQISQKPLIAHVHSTEFDRSGDNANSSICRIEYLGLNAARHVIAVSRYTKDMICRRYRIPESKIEVIYNGVDQDFVHPAAPPCRRYHKHKYVLFLGRVTMQKGPEYFLHAARMVTDRRDDVRFIMAGAGDMLFRMVDLAARLRIGTRVLFTKFLHGPDVQRAYQLADLYVMPSVSEPFGIAPLEAMRQNVPVLISRQSGVSEISRHSLKVDFWDIRQMANKMIAVLSHPALRHMLQERGRQEVSRFRWETSARKVENLYRRSLAV